MKIAVPVTSNNQVDDHFGHCESYVVFNISPNGDIVDMQTIPSVQGCGCKSNIADTLSSDGVSVMLTGGIGGGAINVLKLAGIEVIKGCSGNAAELVKLYISGVLKDSGEICHTHESHQTYGNGNDHTCNH